MDYELLLPALDSLVKNQIGMHLIDSNGQLNLLGVLDVLKEGPNGPTEDFDINSVEINEITVEPTAGDELAFEYNENQLIAYVPEILQEQIRFSVQFVFSEFDKINDGINRLSREFSIDRIGVIDNAEEELKNARKNYTARSADTIHMCRVNVGESIKQLQRSMRNAVDEINRVPKDRKMRLFKVKVNDVLQMEQTARMACLNIMKGCMIYAEISMILDEKQAALDRIADVIAFFEEFSREELMRVEGWNKQKDEFWSNDYYDQKNLLKEKCGDLKMSPEKYTITVR